jgi:hypothetical protein
MIAATRRHLMASGREALNRLNGSINSSVTTLTFEFAAGQIASGALLAIDLELFYVWSVAGQIATVQRGYMGSTAATHADDALIYVNPVVSDFQIFSALNSEIASVSSPTMLYKVKTVTVTATAASTYNLAADVLRVLAVQYNDTGSSSSWPLLRRWDLLPNQDTAVFASGVALRFFEVPAPGRTVRVTYAAALSPLTALADVVETVTGLATSATDIPPLGAAARLLAARESRRSSIDAQPENRQASDVPPGTARSASAALFALRDRRLKEESAKLSTLWPSQIRRVG